MVTLWFIKVSVYLYIYMCKCFCRQEDLSSFLAVAEDLKVIFINYWKLFYQYKCINPIFLLELMWSDVILRYPFELLYVWIMYIYQDNFLRMRWFRLKVVSFQIKGLSQNSEGGGEVGSEGGGEVGEVAVEEPASQSFKHQRSNSFSNQRLANKHAVSFGSIDFADF